MAERAAEKIVETGENDQVFYASELAASALTAHICKKTLKPIKGEDGGSYDHAVSTIKHALRTLGLEGDVIDSAIAMGQKEVVDKLKVIIEAEAELQRGELGDI